jgi:hypothetical protein
MGAGGSADPKTPAPASQVAERLVFTEFSKKYAVPVDLSARRST